MNQQKRQNQRRQKALGTRIRNLRQAKRWPSQAAFAKACGIHPSHLLEIERGAANIKLSTLLKIARTLKITLPYLLHNIV